MGEQVRLQVCLRTLNSSPGKPQPPGTRHKNCHNNPTTPKNNPNTPQIQPTAPQLTPGHHLNMVNHTRPQRTSTTKPQTPTKYNDAQWRHLCSLPKESRIEGACEEQIPLPQNITFTSQQALIITRRKFKHLQKYGKMQHNNKKPQT